MDKASLKEMIDGLRLTNTDSQFVEVKEAATKLPSSTAETISAFANGMGGSLIYGLSERDNFNPVPNFNARAIADGIAQTCAQKLHPPVRAQIEIVPYQNTQVVVATIEAFPPQDKPCYIASKGLYRGAYIRNFDGDFLLSPYEIDRLRENAAQPTHDLRPVLEATVDDLDSKLYQAFIQRQRELHPRAFSSMSDTEIALVTHVLVRDDASKLHPSLAGLVALGRLPQQFFPRLNICFSVFPGEDKASLDGVKYLDSKKLIGPIPEMLIECLELFNRYNKSAGKLEGALRKELPDYPIAAVREAICNAVMHRDYSPEGCAGHIQVNLYSNRLEVLSPGGLYGAVTISNIGRAEFTSCRNQYLADILESTPFMGSYVVENRGTGFCLMNLALADQNMEPPQLKYSISQFNISFYRRKTDSAISPEAQDIVYYITTHGPSTAANMASELGIPRSTLTYKLKKLLESGLIQRDKADKNPRQTYSLASKTS